MGYKAAITKRLLELDNRIKRVCVADGIGVIMEIQWDNPGINDPNLRELYNKAADIAWEHQEIIYSMYSYVTDQDRFNVDTTIRKEEPSFAFGMILNPIMRDDIVCRISRFDHDALKWDLSYDIENVRFAITEEVPKGNGRYSSLVSDGWPHHINSSVYEIEKGIYGFKKSSIWSFR